MKYSFGFLVTTLLALTACQANQDLGVFDRPQPGEYSESNIVGGQLVQDGDPIAKSVAGVFVTSINSKNPKYVDAPASGTAAVISNNIIVTAAHTFKGYQIGSKTLPDGSTQSYKVVVRFGTSLRNGKSYSVSLNDFSNLDVFDPEYLGPDFVLIRIPGGVPKGIIPMLIPESSEKYQPGQRLLIAGYGRNDEGNVDLILRKGLLVVTATEYSKARYKVPPYLDRYGKWFQDYFLETDQLGDTAFCGGDSGGPLYYETEYNGQARLAIAGIHLAKGIEDTTRYCRNSGYELRVDGFVKQARDFYRLVNGT